jgi:hypothetical protein
MAEEALVNIVSYAFEADAAPPIALQCVCTAEQVWLEFRDSGRPFNPLAAPPPQLTAPVEERAAGGLGSTCSDPWPIRPPTTTYDHRQGCNVLQLTRQRRCGGHG